MNTLPQVRIKNAGLLRGAASEPMNRLLGDGTPLLTHEEYQLVVDKYINAWQPYEQKILLGMCDLFDLEFHQNAIDVYIAPWFFAFSDPLVMGVKFSDSRFVSALTHELLHRLLTDNTSRRDDSKDLIAHWASVFGDEHSRKTLVHIPVHAGLKAIYLDILDEPDRLNEDIALCQKNEPYKNAWAYVETHDYVDIIRQLREYHSGREG